MPFQEICNLLLVDFEEGYFDLTVRLQVLSFGKIVINLVEDTLDNSFVSTLDHHITSYFRYARLASQSSDLKTVWALFVL